MMSSTSDRAGIDLRGSAMFARAQHQSFVEQAMIFQVFDQSGLALIKDGEQIILQTWKMV